MKIALIGAGGRAGSRILWELVSRGHEVLALSRTASDGNSVSSTVIRPLDASNAVLVADAVRGHDAVVSATKFTQTNTQNLIDGVTAASVMRLVVVGGAGSLETAPGILEMDDPQFPQAVKPEAEAGALFLRQLRTSRLDWTFISPSRFFTPGQRTGRFRLGKDSLLFDASGTSAISMEDFAVALVDELERPAHLRERFTVGY